jgi:peptide/nickel transport system substrate-binding protein
MIVGICFALALLGPACGPRDAEPPSGDTGQPARGGTIVVGSFTDVDSWNEYRSQQTFAVHLLRRIYLRLVREPGPGGGPDDYRPLLAESWSRSADGLALTFKLRDTQWSDGTPLTASDVRFTWQAQISPEVAWVGAETKQHIRDVEVVDDHTVTFHFDLVYPYQLTDAVDGGIIPQHVFGEVPFADWTTHDWNTPTIGSGPFLMQSHRAGLETVLERNPSYFDAGYSLADRIVVRYVPDVVNLTTQLLAGDIDFLDGVPPRDAQRMATDSDLTLLPYDEPAYSYLGWNGNRPPFDDAELRRALTLAIDREALVEDLLYGFGRVSNGPLPSSWWGASREQEPWPYDPEQARRILAAKGFSVAEGLGSPPSGGRHLAFELITNSGNRLREEMLVKIQEQLGRIGVRVTTLPVEMGTLRQKVGGGDYDSYLGSWVLSGRVDLSIFFRSDGTYNFGGYRSAATDDLFEQIDGVTDWGQIEPLLRQVQKQIHEDQPYTFLYETRRIAAHGPRIAGMAIDVPSDPLAGLERAEVK